MTFDYAAAWRKIAGPAYRALPRNIHELYAATQAAAEDLNQLPDTSMPWPADGGKLRAMFDAVPSSLLAHAARTIYTAGHWYPGLLKAEGHPNVPGVYWKFSHYADQVLRGRFGLGENGTRNERGVGLAILEGRFRVWYASPDAWNWREVAPADEAGYEIAKGLVSRLSQILNPLTRRADRDSAAYQFMEELGKTYPSDTAAFMVATGDEEVTPAEIEERKRQDAAKPGKERAQVLRDFEARIHKATGERDAMLWALDHGLSTDNAIYYDHTRTLCFGWRTPLGPATVSKILDVISEYPGAYEIKCADGKSLKNADAEAAR